jgi:DNA-binding transcriptional regulator YdaS (Cro superfamily)
MKLRQYLDVIGITDAKAAHEIGCTRQHLSRVADGRRRASADFQARVADWSKGQVMPNDWIEEARPRKPAARPKRPLVAA